MNFALPLLLFLLLSLPSQFSDRIRAKAIFALKPLQMQTNASPALAPQLEAHQLRRQLDLVYQWLDSEKHLQEQVEWLKSLQADASAAKEIAVRRTEQLKTVLQKQTLAALAQIIHRDPNSWSSCCWIDVGEEHNKGFQEAIIAKNSPVVAGDSLVGIVEYVGRRQSRVRLISDAGLKVAVRAMRGGAQEREAALLTRKLIQALAKEPRHKGAVEGLQRLQKELQGGGLDEALAKGELSGSSAPYFRSLHARLKGVGFNCDVADAEGPSRDLRSTPPLIQAGDLLLTSGLDGVFPPGLKVGVVDAVEPLTRGSFAYELTALPTAGHFTDLKTVFVLPPLE